MSKLLLNIISLLVFVNISVEIEASVTLNPRHSLDVLASSATIAKGNHNLVLVSHVTEGISLWDLEQKSLLWNFPLAYPASRFAGGIHENGSYALVGDEKGFIYLLDGPTGDVLLEYQANPAIRFGQRLSDVKFKDDFVYVAIGDSILQISLVELKVVNKFQVKYSLFSKIDFLENGDLLALSQSELHKWSLDKPNSPQVIQIEGLPIPSNDGVLIDDTYLLVADGQRFENVLRVNIKTGSSENYLIGHTFFVDKFSYCKAKDLLLTASNDGTTKFWSLDDARLLYSISHVEDSGNFLAPLDVEFSQDCSRLVIVRNNGMIVEYDILIDEF